MSDSLPPRTVPTIVINQGQDSWRDQGINSFTGAWVSPGALQNFNPDTGKKGGWWSVFNGFGKNLEQINKDLVYGWTAQRIATATDVQLDLISVDFYGDQLPRLPGETDDSFRTRIQASLFLPYTTREGFIICLTRLTGFAPRLIEPWNTGDTGGYDWSCYDVDTEGNPGCYGDAGMKYQAGIIAVLPPAQSDGVSIPIWGYDAGAAYDAQTGVFWEPTLQLYSSARELDQLINRIKAFGTTIWRKYLALPLQSWITAQSYPASVGNYRFSEDVQPFVGSYIVLASGSWNANFFIPTITSSGFVLEASNPSDQSGNMINTACIPFTIPNSGSVPVNLGSYSLTVTVPLGAPSNLVMVTPNWDTTVFISAISETHITFEFGSAAPAAASLSIFYTPQGQGALQYVDPDVYFCNISAGELGNVVGFVIPSWNTQMSLTRIGTGFYCQFNNAPPVGSFIHWGWIPVTG